MLFSGRELSGSVNSAYAGPTIPSPILLEVADRINQSASVLKPVRVEATARSAEKARTLAEEVARILGPLVLGGEARVQSVPLVETDAPGDGTIQVLVSR